jgi:hypothetical protein
MPTFEITVTDLDIAGGRSSPQNNCASKTICICKCCSTKGPPILMAPLELPTDDGPITAELLSPLSE